MLGSGIDWCDAITARGGTSVARAAQRRNRNMRCREPGLADNDRDLAPQPRSQLAA